MNVVHIPRRFAPSHWGGTETYILEVCKRLRRDGHAAWVACPDALARVPTDRVEGVPVRRFPYFYPYLHLSQEARHQLDLSGGNMFSFPLLRALWRWPKLDLLHLHTARRTGAIGRYVALKRKIPYVVSVHGGAYDVPLDPTVTVGHADEGRFEWGKFLGWWVGSRRVLDSASAIICVGRKEARETSARHPRVRVEYLPNGVDAHRFAHGDGDGFRKRHGISPGAPLLITVGRIHPQKNQAMLLRILPALRRRHGDVRAVIIGHVTDQGCAQALHALADELPAGVATIIPGLAADSPELVDAYHAADCFVLPSLHEPFGIVLLEAWAAGRAVVASAVGGVIDFVEHGIDGLLCPPDDEAAFARALSLMLENRALRESMALAGWRKASREYTWDGLVRRLERLYEEVADEHLVRA